MIRESTADIIRRRRGMAPMAPDVVQVDVPPEFQAQEQAQRSVQNLGQPDPADVEQATAMLEQQEAARPSSIPAQVRQAVTSAAPVSQPVDLDAREMAAAREDDRESHNARLVEMAAKQFVSGVTRTPMAGVSAPAPSQVPQAQAAIKSRSERAAEVLRLQRQGKMDESTLALQDSQTRKNLREPAEKSQIDYTQTKADDLALRREQLAETVRANKAREEANAKRANRPPKPPKPIEDIPPGFEVAAGSHPGTETRKKFTGLVGASEKMKGLTNQMRAALKGTSGLSRTLDPETVTALKQLGTMIRIEGKTVAELGALSGPDMGLMDAIAADPTSIKANLTVDLPRMLDQLDAWGANSVDGASKASGIVRSGAKAASGKPSPGAGFVRGSVDGKPGWINEAAGEWEPD